MMENWREEKTPSIWWYELGQYSARIMRPVWESFWSWKVYEDGKEIAQGETLDPYDGFPAKAVKITQSLIDGLVAADKADER